MGLVFFLVFVCPWMVVAVLGSRGSLMKPKPF
jgi:hypothetical protein